MFLHDGYLALGIDNCVKAARAGTGRVMQQTRIEITIRTQSHPISLFFWWQLTVGSRLHVFLLVTVRLQLSLAIYPLFGCRQLTITLSVVHFPGTCTHLCVLAPKKSTTGRINNDQYIESILCNLKHLLHFSTAQCGVCARGVVVMGVGGFWMRDRQAISEPTQVVMCTFVLDTDTCGWIPPRNTNY